MSHFMVMAGGTGGHIFPALAVAKVLQEQGHHIIWLGSDGAMETRIVPQHGIELKTIAIKGIRGNGLKRKLLLPFTLIKTISQVKKIIKNNDIKAVIGFGGFVSFPGGVAAKLMGVPLVVHEQNAIAGLSNKVLAKIANRVLYAFPGVFADQLGLVGNPVRQDIIELDHPAKRFKHRQGRLKMLVVGGSLGARVFNEVLPEALALLPEDKRPIIVHQCGRDSQQAVADRYSSHSVKAECVEFIDDMSLAYKEADFIICRAGALTIAELAVAGLGGFLIPFPHAVDDHQTANASYLVKENAGLCIQQTQFNADYIARKIIQLDREQCLIWAENARKLALPAADKQVADIVIELSSNG